MSSKERFKLITAVYLVLRRGDKVLLLRRANTGYQDGKYSLVAGHMEGGELGTTAIIREAKEEAGVTIHPDNLRLVHTLHRLRRREPGQERIELFFEASKWEGDITNCEPGKCDDLSWHPIGDLPANTIPYIRRTLTNVVNGVAYSEYE
jgi:8-oxo-dGTP diphosphatase